MTITVNLDSPTITVLLRAGYTLKRNGIPVELAADTPVKVVAANVPIIFAPQDAAMLKQGASDDAPLTGDQQTGIDEQIDEVERMIQAKGLTAPRITPTDIEANIASEHYFTAYDGALFAGGGHLSDASAETSLALLTFCVLVLKNGFTVTGESACASPENFDAELGRKIARQNAVAKVWPLMGYALKERLSSGCKECDWRL